MTSGWAAFAGGIAVNLIVIGAAFGYLRGRVDAIAPLLEAIGKRLDTMQDDVREVRRLLMGKSSA